MTMTETDWSDPNEYAELQDDTWFGLKLLGGAVLSALLLLGSLLWVGLVLFRYVTTPR